MTSLEDERKIEKVRISERQRIRELLAFLSKHVRNSGSEYTSEVIVPLSEWHAVMEQIG